MQLDTATLLVVVIVASALAGGQLVWASRINREVPALLAWGVAYFLGSGAGLLLLLEGTVSPLLSTGLGNFLFILAFAICLGGAQNLAGKPVRYDLILAGPLLWLVAYFFPAIEDSFNHQVAIASLLAATYLFATAAHIWLSPLKLASQRPAAVFYALHSAVLAMRAVAAISHGATPPPADGAIFSLSMIESIVFITTTTFFVINLSKERVELRHKTAALLDPLTGLANRRGFFGETERMMERLGTRPVAVLLFDLDAFKLINDTFGHPVGDHVLKIFAAVLRSAIRADDIVARLGGEEFAIVMPAGTNRASSVAETIVRGFAEAAASVEGLPVKATVSAGFAVSGGEPNAIDDALIRADRALYRAKHLGRNRAELAPEPEPKLAIRPVRAA